MIDLMLVERLRSGALLPDSPQVCAARRFILDTEVGIFASHPVWLPARSLARPRKPTPRRVRKVRRPLVMIPQQRRPPLELPPLPEHVDPDTPFPKVDGSQPCVTAGADWWWSEELSPAHFGEAVRLCATCPFFAACRDWALVNEEYGIWGGTSGKQRAEWRTAHHVRLRVVSESEYWRGPIMRRADAGWTSPQIAQDIPLSPDAIGNVIKKARRSA